jgi:hypothetical protein
MCWWLDPVDDRCEEEWGVDGVWGIGERQAQMDMEKYGFVGCPGNGEEMLKKTVIESKWSEEKARRMLELVIPGIFEEVVAPAPEVETYGRWSKQGKKKTVVDEMERPFNLPADVLQRRLPPYGAILQKENLNFGCHEWTVGRRGMCIFFSRCWIETCANRFGCRRIVQENQQKIGGYCRAFCQTECCLWISRELHSCFGRLCLLRRRLSGGRGSN